MSKMRLALRRSVGLTMALAAAACIPLPGGNALTSRTVAGKGLDHLIAADGSTCPASEKTMNEVRIGEPKTCIWKGGMPGQVGRPQPDFGRRPRTPKGTTKGHD